MNIMHTINILIISICATIILIVAIKNVWSKPNECKNCIEKNIDKRRKIHLLYISGIAISIIIILFSYITVNSDNYNNINTYFTFASTIVSIVLAVVTIVYSITTSESTSNSLGALDKTTKSIRDASSEVSNASKIYSDSANKLENNIKRILETIENVKDNTEKLLDDRIFESIKSSKNKTYISTSNINENFIKDFIRASSIVGNLLLYACAKAKVKEKKFTPSLFDDNSGLNYNDYVYGFMIAISSLNLVTATIKIPEGNDLIEISIIESNFDFIKLINEWIQETNPDKTYGDFTKFKNRIDDYFI